LERSADLKALQKTLGKINQGLLASLLFCLPLSTSAVSILAVLILVVWCVEGGFKKKFHAVARNQFVLVVLGYLSLFVIGLLWTEDIAAGLDTVRSQWNLLLLPVFMTIIRPGRERLYLYSFVAGTATAMVMTYLAWFDLLHFGGLSPQQLTRGTSHVVYNPLLAFAIYIILHELKWGPLHGGRRWLFALLGCCMSFNMFITAGRAGQIAFFVLLSLFLLQLFRKNLLRAVLIVAILIPCLFAVGYTLSPVFKNRIDTAWHEISNVDELHHTSVGMRIIVAANTWHIIKEHWLLGVGTGDFTSAYAVANRERSPDVVEFVDPHNQYLFSWCRFGLPGLFALLGIFACQIFLSFKISDNLQHLRLALPVFYLTIMFSVSYLEVYETGFLFSIMSAVLYFRPWKPLAVA
jgi:O-antigen ligase